MKPNARPLKVIEFSDPVLAPSSTKLDVQPKKCSNP
jgi:hypothetical protein